MASEAELEAIRRRKYEEMAQVQAGSGAEEEKRQEIEEAKRSIIGICGTAGESANWISAEWKAKEHAKRCPV